MPKYRVNFAVTYEVEAENEEQAIEIAERDFYEDLGREGYSPSEVFGLDVEEIENE